MKFFKYIHLPQIVEATSERTQDLFSERMMDLERATYRFFIIKKRYILLHIL